MQNKHLFLALLLTLSQPCLAQAPPNVASTTAANVTLPATNEGDNALNVGDYARAERYFASALGQSGLSKEQEGYLRTGYGEALLWLDRVSEAAAQFKKARNLIMDKGGGDAARQVRLLDDQAWLAQAQNKLDVALQYAEDARRLGKSASGISPIALVSCMMHVAYLQDQNQQLEAAAASYAEALAAEEKANGPQTLVAADIKKQLGGVLRRLGKNQEAQKFFQEGLQVKFAANAPLSAYAPHPYWNDVIFRYNEGAPNCYRKSDGGRDLQIITANGVTVAAGVSSDQDALVKSGRVDLTIRNESNGPIQVLPKEPVFYVTAPKMVLARQLNPSDLASKVEKKGQKKAGWIRFMGENATRSETSTMIGNGGYWGCPPVYSAYGTVPFVSRSGNMTMITTQVPDYAAQERALAKAAAVAGKARDTAEQIRNQGLAPTTLGPQQEISGSLYFEIGKMTKAWLQVPIGNAVFEYDFPPR